MFGRKVEVRLVKDKKVVTPTTPAEKPVDYIAIAKDLSKQLVIGTVVVITATIVLTAAADIATSHLSANQN